MKLNGSKLLLAVFILLLNGIALKADVSGLFFNGEKFALNARIGFEYNFYLLNTNGFRGSVDCGLFQNGFGWGLPFGIDFERYFDSKMFYSAGIGFNINSGLLIQEIKFPMRDVFSGNIVDVTTENQLKVDFGIFELNGSVGYNIINEIEFATRASFGLKLGLATGKSFTQKEVITSPSFAVFVNADNYRTKERPLASGDIATMSIPLIIPQIAIETITKDYGSYRFSIGYQVNNYTTDTKWNAFTLKLDAGYRFSFFDEVKTEDTIEIEPIPTPEPIKIETPPDPIVTIKDINITGKVQYGSDLIANIPIVNSVFFETNEYNIPPDYKITENLESYLKGDPITAHYYIIPRIASILKQNPDAYIVLQSGTSGEGNENNILELSRKRAEAVKNAFMANNIPESRIKIEVLAVPKIQSNQNYIEGVKENQRVDILLRNARLIEYINVEKNVKYVGMVHFDVFAANLGEKEVWIGNNMNQNQVKIDRSGLYSLDLQKEINENKTKDTLILSYSLGNQTIQKEKELDYNQFPKEMVEMDVEKFYAVLRFDYNQSNLSEENKELLRQLVEMIPKDVKILVIGSADELGTAQRNSILAKERAKNTVDYIKQIAKRQINVEIGENNDKYDEKYPQGRFLNRSIKLKLIKEK